MKRKRKSRLQVGLIFAIIFCNALVLMPTPIQGTNVFFKLMAKVHYVYLDEIALISKQLERIGIDVDITTYYYFSYIELLAYRNYDLTYFYIHSFNYDPDYSVLFSENGSLNFFGYHTRMDFDEKLGTGINEWYLDTGLEITPPYSEERIQHYRDWQQYLMDKILPAKPTLSREEYDTYWSNLEGYNITDGLLRSWGKMSWNGLHTEQISTDELVLADSKWYTLNPLFNDEPSEGFICNAILDDLITMDSDGSYWPHLAESITMINDTHYRIKCRENIKWQSDPDGNFTNEYFDAEDVYFSLYSWNELSHDQHKFDWIKDMLIVDEYTIDLFIDEDPSTPTNEPFSLCIEKLQQKMLPEHYLNQTQLEDGKTPNITHPAWEIYETNCFGTGLFKFDSFTEDIETNLILWEDCWRMNSTITNDESLNWTSRYGTFDDPINNLRIRLFTLYYDGFSEYLSGRIDFMDILDYQEIANLLIGPDHMIQKDSKYATGFLAFNMRPIRPMVGNEEPAPGDPSITKGLAIRKAIAYATDAVEMNDIIFGGELDSVYHPIPSKLNFWCNPNIIKYDYNLEKAKEYMRIAGFEFISILTNIDYQIYLISLSTIAIFITISNRRKK